MTSQEVTFFDASQRQLTCKGDWNITHFEELRNLLLVSMTITGEAIVNSAGIKI